MVTVIKSYNTIDVKKDTTNFEFTCVQDRSILQEEAGKRPPQKSGRKGGREREKGGGREGERAGVRESERERTIF